MDRITTEKLQYLVDRINSETGMPIEPYTKNPDHSYTANTGNYHLDSAYGNYSLVRMSIGGGESTIIDRCTNRELYDQMRAFLKGMATVKEMLHNKFRK